MTKPVILVGKLEGQERYTLLNGQKPLSFVYERGKDREAFLESVGREFVAEIESSGFYELPEIKNGTILTRSGVQKVDVSGLKRIIDSELAHFSDEDFVELRRVA